MRYLRKAFGRPARAAPVVGFPGIAACLLLSACATVPPAIREAPPGDVQLVEVLRDGPSAYAGTPVRWGGTLMSVTVREGETWLEILERELDSAGEPERGRASDGRFLAVVAGSDESGYRLGRDITVSGVIEDAFEGSIGRRGYTFPVVRVEASYLWEPDYYAYYPYGYYGRYHPHYPYPAYPYVYGPYYRYPWDWHPYFY